MTDREYVESTVAYLAEHVPWMWKELLKTFGGKNGASRNWRNCSEINTTARRRGIRHD